ncbi:hypothetical protein J421_5160 (plasmid) [Gemmatirosa kalamazoonensis]|uniref:Glycine zipper domain-containing protein n=1 Tax=Gemmatirosa kalamazoonensis TaxID=861299 RepID=W0RQX0_9BACT|nr:hypothetical protein [Gemmatirosa kalamazoonensis]AHG92695.1 hypothetical protein J421_5160 [Gemmatirosa kalamazoonensis]
MIGALVVGFLLSVSPHPAAAQDTVAPVAVAASPRVDPRLLLPPTSRPATLGPAVVAIDPASRARGRRAVAFMAGGVAGVVAGALIKGNVGGVLAMGGAVATFYGLEQYMVRNDPPVSTRH